MGQFIDLTGKKFHRWTVIKKSNIRDKQKRILWECECECSPGTIHLLPTATLKNGSSKSCGCLQREIAANTLREMRKRYNEYDLSGDYGIGYTTKNERFYFDLDDYDKIKNFCWFVDNYGYVATNIRNESDKQTKLLMHRLIMDCNDSKISVDHINHITYDNRKDNLRLVTQSQNLMNRSLGNNNTSGVTGVYFDNHRNKWVAEIKINRKKHNLGGYKNFDDAVAARKAAEKKYFGEFSYDTSAAQTDIKESV